MKLRGCAAVLVAIGALLCSTLAIGQVEPADRLTTPILASQRVQTNQVHPLATKQNDLGRVNGSQVFHRMVLLLQRSTQQEADLQQLLKDQQDPSSPQYHKWLTPTEFGQRFGPSLNDIAKITGWLQSQGFTVEKPSNGRQFLFFTGSSAQVETAFQTQMHNYTVNGRTYMANATPASVPTALSPAVRGVASLNSFGVTHYLPQLYPAAKPQILNGQEAFTGPADLSAIYDATPLQTAGIKGQGQSIALIEESNINLQDLADFRSVTGLPAANVNVIVNGPDPGLLAATQDEFEAISDAEWAGAMAPDATLNIIVSASTELNQGIDLSTAYAVDNQVAPVTSLSYGGCETLYDNFDPIGVSLYDFAWEQGAAQGMTHFVASGDEGGDSCLYTGLNAGYGVNAIGSTPWNVAVGGTEFIMPDPNIYFPPPNYAATGYIPESTWNDYENPYDGRPLAGNGGASIDWTKPSWQAGTGVPADGERDVPDVSLLAGDNEAYLTCERDIGLNCAAGNGGGVIGTSISTVNWASIQTLVNQKNNLINGAGNPNPTYYQLAAGANSPFHDITIGDTKVPDPDGELLGYEATPGYDLATGLGSVDVNKLATNWLAPTGSGTSTVTISTGGVTSITHGDSLTASVNVSSGTSTIPSGDAVFIAGTQGLFQVTLDNTGNSSVQFGTVANVELPGGSYNLTARYAGDSNFAPATSNAIPLTVNAEPTTTTIANNSGTAPPYVYGEPVILSAVSTGVNSGTKFPVPGTYTFVDGGTTTLGTATLAQTGESLAYATVGVTANLTLQGAQSLSVGAHTISAASPPTSASFLASTSTTPVAITVTKAPVLVGINTNTTAPPLNSNVNLSASVIGEYGAPVTGQVAFIDYTDSNAVLGTVTLATTADAQGGYDATLPVAFTTAGLHVIFAEYLGDTNNLGGGAFISGVVNITVGGKASTSTTFTTYTGLVSGEFALAQNSISVTAKVVGSSGSATPTGVVTFTDAAASNAVVGTATVMSNGTATLTTKTLTGGTHFLVANYPGDTNFTGSISQSVEVIVGDFTFAAGTTSTSIADGQTSTAITLTYTGSADFTQFAGGAALGSITLSCSGLPAGSSCAFTPSVITPTDNANGTTTGTATLTITTTGPTLQKAANRMPDKPRGMGTPLALAGLLALGLPLAFKRRRYFAALLGLVLLAAISTLSGCNNGGTLSYYVNSTGTPAGSSTVTVTAAINGGAIYGTVTHTATINLTVTAQGN